MDPLQTDFTEKICDTSVKQTIIEQCTDTVIIGDEKFQKITNLEASSDNITEPKPVSNDKKDKKINKSLKSRQQIAEQSAINRPKTARQKTLIDMNSVQKIHSPGTVPKCVKKLKNTKESESRPDSSNSVLKEQFKQELHGDVLKSSATEVITNDDSEKFNSEIATQKNTILNLKGKISDLKKNIDSLQKQLDVSVNKENAFQEKIKQLELKISQVQNEKKNKFEEKITNYEVEKANLIKEKQDLSMKNNIMSKENQNLENQMKELRNELKVIETSLESMSKEKEHLQVLLEKSASERIKDSEEKLTDEIKNLLNQNEALKTKLEEKICKIDQLKEDNCNLINEVDHLKSQVEKQYVDQSKQTLNIEIENLQQRIEDMNKVEKELNQKILTLNSKLDDEKNANIRNNVLLECRAEYIKALQDIDNLNKTRLVIRSKELRDARIEIKSFDKFKAAHDEEKKNFMQVLKNLETENTQLKTKIEMLEKKDSKLK